MENENQINKGVLFKGIIGSALFIYIGYLISGILGYVDTDALSYSDAAVSVLQNPLGSYFNDYSPVTMILGFIFFEVVYFYFIVRRQNNKQSDDDMVDSDIINAATNAGIDNTASVMKDKNLFEDVFSSRSDTAHGEAVAKSSEGMENSGGYVMPDSISVNSITADTYSDDYDQKEESIASFNDDIVNDLLYDYNLEQIRAMVPMRRYIHDLTAQTLRNLFSVDMHPEDITFYISMFYG